MFVLITYDVNTEDKAGQRRLRRVAKQCLNYGVRVQNSVFECNAEPDQIARLKATLTEEIDLSKDSLRFYYLGTKNKATVEHFGNKETIDVNDTLLF